MGFSGSPGPVPRGVTCPKSLENGQAQIGLVAVDSAHAFYLLSGSDNMIVFTTERYKERPLVVRGPGAGAAG